MMKTRNTVWMRRGGFGFRPDGFTLVEMLVVIGILGILSVALLSTFSYVKNSARKAQAQNLVAEVAIAFTRYLQENRGWPQEFLNKNSVGLDEQVVYFLQKEKLIDLTAYKVDSSGELLREINTSSVDRFGLLDPWAQRTLKRKPSTATAGMDAGLGNGRTFANHRLQFRLDQNLDGFVDASEGSPQGVRVRASVLVWSRGPDGIDDFDQNGRYPSDDSLSWPHAQYKAGQ